MRGAAFSPGEVFGAVTLSSLVQAGVVALLVFGRGAHPPTVEPEPEMIAVAVKPVIEDESLPILKKGKPNPPKPPPEPPKPPPKEEFDNVSAPAPVAPPTPPPKPPPPVAKPEEKPPTPEAPPVVKKVARPPLVVEREEDPNAEDEGAEEGAVGGTEKDPLKARAISLYQQKLIAWFQRGFIPPLDAIPCPTLVTLKVKVVATIGPDRVVTAYTVTGTSGNSIFDARVRERMDKTIGQEVPPPPPNYPDLAEARVFPAFTGKDSCK
jgi:outer membrane biosynthesis protein TonB